MKLHRAVILGTLLLASCGWMACGCVPPPGLNLNVFRQTAPAVLQGIVEADGTVRFEWSTVADNVSLHTTDLPTSAEVMPHLSGTLQLEPDPAQDLLTFSQVMGTLQVREGDVSLSIPLQDDDWMPVRNQGMYVVESFLALEGQITDPLTAQKLHDMLSGGPENQAHLAFSLQTSLPAGTQVTVQLEEIRVRFR